MKTNKIFIAIFFIITLGIYPVYLLCGTGEENRENRTLTQWQDVADASFMNKTGVIESFINDHAPFKDKLVSLNAGLHLKLFGASTNADVVFGKEGWLFQNKTDDADSIADYQGAVQYTEEQMQLLKDKLLKLQNVLDEKEIELKILVAPNKEQVYSRYMPDNIPVVGENKLIALERYLTQDTDLCFVYPLDYLKSISGDEQIYYKYDTHWNNAGALYATQLLFDDFDKSVPEIVDEEPLTDLADVSGIYSFIQPDVYYKVKVNVDSEPEKMVYFLHDSFGDMMLPLLYQPYHVRHVTFAQIQNFNIDEETDILCIEICERYFYRMFDTIDRIIENAEGL